MNLPALVSTLFVNGAAGGFSVDPLLVSVVFWLLTFQQVEESDGTEPSLFIVLNMMIGLCGALRTGNTKSENEQQQSR